MTLIATAGAEYTEIALENETAELSLARGFKCKFMSSLLLSESSELSEPYPWRATNAEAIINYTLSSIQFWKKNKKAELECDIIINFKPIQVV